MAEPNTTLKKNAADVLVFIFNWRRWLESANISTSTWSITGPDSVLTKDNESIINSNKRTRVRLSAGTVGATYTIANTIVTNETPTQTKKQVFYITVA